MSIQQSLKDRAKRETKSFELPDIGTVLIQSMTVGERQTYADAAESMGETGRATRTFENAYGILSKCVIDPETGDLPFAGDEGRALFFGVNNETLIDALFDLALECLKFNGLVKDPAAAGKDESTAVASSTS